MITRKLLLYFPRSETEKPIVYHLVKDYGLMVNIFRAKVTPEEEGYLVLDVTGEEPDIERGMDYVRTFKVTISEARSVQWDERKCTACGNCVPHCPTEALSIPDRSTMRVVYDRTECVECLSCLTNCPFGACSSLF